MKFFVPAEFKKSENTQEMRICGFASTPDLDREGEQIVQKGLEISDFLDHGFFNYNHDNSFIVGYPDKNKTELRKEGLYVEGNILPSELGLRIWDAAIALQKSNAPRKMGFSIEGKVLSRGRDGRITKAKIYNVAITPTPVNPNATWEALVKSMTTSVGGALIPESLDGVMHCLNHAQAGEVEYLEVFNDLRDHLNESIDERAVCLYLRLFKGYHGEELENKTKDVLRELEGTHGSKRKDCEHRRCTGSSK